MDNILRVFCPAFSQRVNVVKFGIWYSLNTNQSIIHAISETFGIPSTFDLGKYLDFPLVGGRIQSKDFQYLTDRVSRKLGGWQHRILSRAARVILMQAVTSTIPAYAMGVCKLSMKTLEDLERINRNFLWGDLAQQKSTRVLTWDCICQPKARGGLGFRSLKNKNWVLLAKLAWRTITHQDAF